MFRSPARTVGQLGAALALACLGLGTGAHPALAVSGPYVQIQSDKCTSACSFQSHPAASPLSVNIGDTVTYDVKVITDVLDSNNYGGATINSAPASGFNFNGTCNGISTDLPYWPNGCTGPNPVKWTAVAAVPSHGNIYDFYYQVTVGCGSTSTVSTSAYFASTSPAYSSGAAYEYAQVSTCGTPAVTNTNGSWPGTAYVGVSSFYTATVTSSGSAVTSGTVTFSYGAGGASCPSTGAVMNFSNLNNAGTASINYAFSAAGNFTVFAWYYPPSGSSQYQPSCFSQAVSVVSTSGGTPTPGSGVSTNISVAWGNPVSQNASQFYSGTVHANGSPVTVGTVWFGYGGTSCGSGITNMGSAPVNSSGVATLVYAFSNSGTYTISVSYQPPIGSLFLSSCSSSGLTVSPVTSSSTSPSPSASPTPSTFPTATPNNFPTPSGLGSFFVSNSQVTTLPATGPTAATAVASSPPVVAGNVVVLAQAPPRQLPELQVLNAGSVLALQALNAGPFIAILDILAVLGLIWHLRRRVGSTDED